MEHRGRQPAPRQHRPGYGHGDRRPGGNGAWFSTSKATPADAMETRSNATTPLPLRTTSGGTIRPRHDNTFQREIGSATDVDCYELVITFTQGPSRHMTRSR